MAASVIAAGASRVDRREPTLLPPGEVMRFLRNWRSDALMPYVELLREHGPIVQARVPGAHQYVLYLPAHAEHVLVTNQDNYIKGPEYDFAAGALGRGLITSEGDLWRRQRKLMQPMFAKRHLKPLMGHTIDAANHLVDRWSELHLDGSSFDVADEMRRLAVDVVGRALFGADLTGSATDTIKRTQEQILYEVISAGRSPLVWGAYALPGVTMERALMLRPRSQRQFRRRVAELDAVVNGLIARRRASSSTTEGDLLGLLLSATDEGGARLSDQQVRDEVVTFIIAGFETTANTLSWMWWLLSTHPQARERLYTEVDELLDGREPTFDDADRLRWTQAVLKETMRLYPPLWGLFRRVKNDDVIDGVRIRAGATVAVIVYMTHRDPAVWPNPEGFDPSRFLGRRPRDRPMHAYLPFAAGRRVCLGNTFGLVESTLLTVKIAQRFRLDAAPGALVVPEALTTLRPRGALRMRLQCR